MSGFLIILYLVGNYTTFAIYLGGEIIFPSALANAAGGLLLLVHWNRSKQFLAAVAPSGLLLAIGAIALSVIVPSFEDGQYMKRIASAAQFTSSIISGLGFLFGLLATPRRTVVKAANIIVWSILVVGFYEAFLGGNRVMQQINTVIYAWRPDQFYTAVGRDEAIWGGVRPLVFSREPSFVAAAALIAILTSALADERPMRLANLTNTAAQLGLSLIVLRSGVLVFAFPILGFGFLLMGHLRRLNTMATITVIAGAVLFLPLLGGLMDNLTRHSETGSFFARIVAPVLVFGEVSATRPLFGVGLGGWDMMTGPVLKAWASVGSAAAFGWSAETETNDLIMSSWWTYWIFMGLLGGTMFWTGLIITLKKMRLLSHATFAVMATATFWLTIGGGALDARSWMMFFIFAAVPDLARSNNPKRRRPRYRARRGGYDATLARQPGHLVHGRI